MPLPRPIPASFTCLPYIGPRGWIGLRLDRGKIDWNEVRDLVTASYLQVAPKRLASQVKSALG
ncbi:MAG: MmcQ/YjbR family DNA-binding protein [Alloacidobacterium sp.]|jgi:predicted DNA-binding protein (MmcQ/YjbR family)